MLIKRTSSWDRADGDALQLSFQKVKKVINTKREPTHRSRTALSERSTKIVKRLSRDIVDDRYGNAVLVDVRQP